MEVNIPNHINKLRIADFDSLLALDEIQDKKRGPTITEIIKINSLFSDLSIEDLRQVDVKSNNLIYSSIMKMLDTFHPKPMPPAEVVINDQKYILIKDFTKLPTGWYVDVDAMTTDVEMPTDDHPDQVAISNRMKDEPQIMAAFCYLEEGMSYAQIDQHKNIINPIAPRAQVFAEHFPLNHFIDLTTFFLRIYVEWKGSSIRTEKNQKTLKQMMRKLELLNGKLQSMQ